jgi:hypothetical protein
MNGWFFQRKTIGKWWFNQQQWRFIEFWNNHPNWRTHILQRAQPPTRYITKSRRSGMYLKLC